MANFQYFSSFQGTGGIPMRPDPEYRVGDQEIGSLGSPISFGFQVRCGSGELSCKKKTPLVNFPRRFFYKMSFNCISRDE